MNKLLLVTLFLLAPVSLASADMKVAVVDLGKAFEQYYKTKDDTNSLKQKEAGYEKELRDLISDYNHMGEEAQTLEKASQDPTLSAAAQEEKKKALETKKQDMLTLANKLQEMKVERTRELDDEKFRLHQEIVGEITKVISNYSGPQGFDLVIDKSPQSGSGVPIVLYSSTKLVDITADIIKLLNQSAPASSGVNSGATSTAPATPAVAP